MNYASHSRSATVGNRSPSSLGPGCEVLVEILPLGATRASRSAPEHRRRSVPDGAQGKPGRRRRGAPWPREPLQKPPG